MTLREAIQVLLDEGIEDYVYEVRDRASQEAYAQGSRTHNRWELPRVKAFAAAIVVLKKEVAA